MEWKSADLFLSSLAKAR
jgi:hypothetical protein